MLPKACVVKQILLRVAGFIVGAVSAYASLNVVFVQVNVFIGESEWHKTHPLSYFDVVLWVGATGVGAFFFGWLSYASLRYATRPHPQTDAK